MNGFKYSGTFIIELPKLLPVIVVPVSTAVFTGCRTLSVFTFSSPESPVTVVVPLTSLGLHWLVELSTTLL